MKTTLSIQIDCEERRCGSCKELAETEQENPYCTIFDEELVWVIYDDDPIIVLRCEACLTAQEGANE